MSYVLADFLTSSQNANKSHLGLLYSIVFKQLGTKSSSASH